MHVSMFLAAGLVGAAAVGAVLTGQPGSDEQQVKPLIDQPRYEAPDGAMMGVVARQEVTLLIEDLRIGDGEVVKAGAQVTIHYHGSLKKDGSVFDTTRGKDPIEFPLQGLIPGWQAGVPGMKVGGIRRLTLPHQMAYGEHEISDATGKVVIPAKSDLVFTIEMLRAINPPERPKAPEEANDIGDDAKASPNYPEPTTMPSGLVIHDLVVGTGKVCPPGATVTVHYRGTLEDGTEFDSSYKRGDPATFPLARLIKGWQEGIPGMQVGGKRKLVCPYPLAYGEAGKPPNIPPRATLTFEIELLDVK